MSEPAGVVGRETPWDLLRKTIGTLAVRLRPEHIGTGTLAELKRTEPDVPPPAFWRLFLASVPEDLRRGDAAERAWTLIIGGMARMTGEGHSAHVPHAGLGGVLARTGYAETRLIRFLRAHDAALAVEVRIISMWFANKGENIDWVEVAEFVLGRIVAQSPFDADRTGRKIARDYFAALSRSATKTETPEAVDE